MDDFCKKFIEEHKIKGAYCKRTNVTCNAEFCLHTCHGKWDGKGKLPLPFEQMSKWEMLKHFALAVKRAAGEGFARVDERTYAERLICCNSCGGDVRCPYCGCGINWKALLKSEAACPNPTTYPNLTAYPPRNYWQVADQTVSVIIPARNENPDHLQKTIDSLFASSTGQIEILVGLDGYDIPPDVDLIKGRPVKVIREKTPLGRRKLINKLVAASQGTYLFHLDGHCSLTEGWDTKLKWACGDNDLAYCVIKPIDRDSWEYRAGHYGLVYIDSSYNEKWWDRKPIDQLKLIEPSMGFTGCAWLIKADRFRKFGGCDENLGEYGWDGPEWSLKIQLDDTPGQVLLRTDVVCGHVFSTNQNSHLYKPRMLSNEQYVDYMSGRYGNKMQELVEKFHPVPTWDSPAPVVTKTIIIKQEHHVVVRDADGNIIAEDRWAEEPVEYVEETPNVETVE